MTTNSLVRYQRQLFPSLYSQIISMNLIKGERGGGCGDGWSPNPGRTFAVLGQIICYNLGHSWAKFRTKVFSPSLLLERVPFAQVLIFNISYMQKSNWQLLRFHGLSSWQIRSHLSVLENGRSLVTQKYVIPIQPTTRRKYAICGLEIVLFLFSKNLSEMWTFTFLLNVISS